MQKNTQPETTTTSPTCGITASPTTGAPTSETTTNAGTTKDTTTESPIIEPSILPTANPTTSQPTTTSVNCGCYVICIFLLWSCLHLTYFHDFCITEIHTDELILEHKDTASGYFSTSIRTTGLENEDDPTANTYSIIGNLNATEYLDNNGDYLFKMIYYNDDDAISDGNPENYTLIWKQSTWLTETGVQGYQGISIPTLTVPRAARSFYFVGLSLSSYSSYVYLDGIPAGISSYRNSAGYFGTSSDNIPAYNHAFATGQQLFIWNDKDCPTTKPPTTGAPTSETTTNAGTTKDTTTESPIIEPSILPTANPTTSQPTGQLFFVLLIMLFKKTFVMCLI